jgi:hypothetical protein
VSRTWVFVGPVLASSCLALPEATGTALLGDVFIVIGRDVPNMIKNKKNRSAR